MKNIIKNRRSDGVVAIAIFNNDNNNKFQKGIKNAIRKWKNEWQVGKIAFMIIIMIMIMILVSSRRSLNNNRSTFESAMQFFFTMEKPAPITIASRRRRWWWWGGGKKKKKKLNTIFWGACHINFYKKNKKIHFIIIIIFRCIEQTLPFVIKIWHVIYFVRRCFVGGG